MFLRLIFKILYLPLIIQIYKEVIYIQVNLFLLAVQSDELGQMSRDMQPVPKSRQSVFSSLPKCPHSIFLGRKAMTNLDGVLKHRDITLPTKVRLVKSMVFPVAVHGELDHKEG